MIGFILYALVCLWLIVYYETNFQFLLWQFALIVFVLTWIGQFYGHKVEGKKPRFFKDVQFLLIDWLGCCTLFISAWGFRTRNLAA